MAAPLQYKTRVRLPDEPWAPPMPRRRRGRLALLGATTWLGLALLCYSVATGALPLAHWLGARRAPLAERATASRSGPLRARAVQAAAIGSGDATGGTSEAPAAAQSAIEPAPGSSSVASVAAAPPPRPDPDRYDSNGIDPFAASDGVGDNARDTGEAIVDDAPTMATSSGIGHTSCEDAIEADEDQSGPPAAADPRVAKLVGSGRWFSDCGSVKLFEVHLCVAVKGGRTVGVTVHTLPAHHAIVTCIANQAWALRFPKTAKLEVARASFAPE
jgi:hypothetical protein